MPDIYHWIAIFNVSRVYLINFTNWAIDGLREEFGLLKSDLKWGSSCSW